MLLLGGDVHYSSISEIDLGPEQRSRVHQLVCSPFRNPLSKKERRTVQLTASRAAARVFAKLAGWAGVDRPTATWKPLRRPTFENAISELMLDGANARVVVRRSPREGEDPERLVPEAAVPLAGALPA